jgi:hypothetical protein
MAVFYSSLTFCTTFPSPGISTHNTIIIISIIIIVTYFIIIIIVI